MLGRLSVENKKFSQLIYPFLSLFTSLGTLICCALPALLISLGMGASLITILSTFQWIVVLSKYKIYIFLTAGILLMISFFLFWQGRNAPCPSDPFQARICSRLRSTNLIMIIISLTIFIIFICVCYSRNFIVTIYENRNQITICIIKLQHHLHFLNYNY